MKLRELQLQFKDYLLNGNLAIEQAIVSNEKINANERLSIYKDGCLQLFIDLLAADFPHLKTLLADEFEIEIERYVVAYPGDHYLPNYLGKNLSQFFAENQKPTLWQEMADLEYAMIEITDKKNDAILTLEKLSTLPPEQWLATKLILCDATAIKTYSSNAPFIWLKNSETNNQQHDWLIWRKDFQIKLKAITAEEKLILQSMQQQKSFMEICDDLCQIMTEEQAAPFMMQFLAQALEDKLIKDF